MGWQVHLLALQEEEAAGAGSAGMAAAKFGFAFLDAAAGHYYVGAVHDDAGRANLSALLTQVTSASSCGLQWCTLPVRFLPMLFFLVLQPLVSTPPAFSALATFSVT